MNISPRITFLMSLSIALATGAVGCRNSQTPANTNTATTQNQPLDQSQQDQSQDPASANIAPISNATTGAPDSGGQTYSQSAPPPPAQSTERRRRSTPARDYDRYPANQYGSAGDEYDNSYPYDNYDSYQQPVAYATQPPPPLPEYDQPPCPGEGYQWTPGYWNYASNGYYWVPGAWVSAPFQGALWTPGFWDYDNGRRRYAYHRGYWGRHVGYYGGINYGHGYSGYGYQGGYWNGDRFDYNRSVNNVNPTVVHDVYNYTVVNNTNTTINRVSYNGPGGVQAKPRPAEIVAIHEQHAPPMTAQLQQAQAARSNRGNFAAVNQAHPAVVAVTHPLPADHNVKAPPPVPMRTQPAPQTPAQQPHPSQPAAAAPQQHPPAVTTPQQHHPAPVQQPIRQPAPGPSAAAPQHPQPASRNSSILHRSATSLQELRLRNTSSLPLPFNIRVASNRR